MSEIRIQNLCHKKSILVNIYRQSLLRHLIQVTSYSLTPLIFEGSSALTISHVANLPLCLRHQNQIHIKSILMQPSSRRARPDQCKCRNDVGNRDLQHQVFHGKPQTRICHYTIEVARCWDFTFQQGVHLLFSAAMLFLIKSKCITFIARKNRNNSLIRVQKSNKHIVDRYKKLFLPLNARLYNFQWQKTLSQVTYRWKLFLPFELDV